MQQLVGAAATWTLLRLGGALDHVHGDHTVLGGEPEECNTEVNITMCADDNAAGYGPGLATDYYKGFLERVMVAAEENTQGVQDTVIGEQVHPAW